MNKTPLKSTAKINKIKPIMKKKTILYLVTQSELGGAQKYVLDLARAMRNDYNVVVGLGEQGERGWLADRLSEEKIEYHYLSNLKRPINLYRDIMAFWDVAQLISQVKPDILHLNSSKASVIGSYATKLVSKKRKPKIVYTAHGWVFKEPLSAKKRKLYYRAEKFSADCKDKIICISEFDRRVAIKEEIVPEDKIKFIPNGIAPVDFLPREEARRLIWQEIDPNEEISPEAREEKPLLGTIGNLYKNKGFNHLINAAKMLVDYGLDIKLVIVGEGGERNELEDWISQLRLEKNVFLLGSIESASRRLKALDIYVCSSVKEGLSYTIIEAMQAGLPIVATNIGGNPDLITHNQEGLLIEPGSAENLATGIIKILNNDQKKKLGAKAREKALKNYSLERMANDTKQVYQDLFASEKNK